MLLNTSGWQANITLLTTPNIIYRQGYGPLLFTKEAHEGSDTH